MDRQVGGQMHAQSSGQWYLHKRKASVVMRHMPHWYQVTLGQAGALPSGVELLYAAHPAPRNVGIPGQQSLP